LSRLVSRGDVTPRCENSCSSDDAALAAQVGCPVNVLTNLRLCQRPGGAQLQEGVAMIAERFGLDAVALGRVLGVNS
jgi:hypothetical protein